MLRRHCRHIVGILSREVVPAWNLVHDRSNSNSFNTNALESLSNRDPKPLARNRRHQRNKEIVPGITVADPSNVGSVGEGARNVVGVPCATDTVSRDRQDGTDDSNYKRRFGSNRLRLVRTPDDADKKRGHGAGGQEVGNEEELEDRVVESGDDDHGDVDQDDGKAGPVDRVGAQKVGRKCASHAVLVRVDCRQRRVRRLG